MKLHYLIVLTALALSPLAIAADSDSRSSPIDNNPVCMDRTTDASAGDCVTPSDGTPRHRFPPRSSATSGASGTTSVPAAPAATSPRKVTTGNSGGK